MANIFQISPNDFSTYSYDEKDINLVPSFEVDTSIESDSYIEYLILDLNKSQLFIDYNYNSYSIIEDLQSSLNGNISKIQINPENDLSSQGFTQGSYYTYYNFLNKKIGSPSDFLYITEISTDRKELRLDSNVISKEDLIKHSSKFITERENNNFFIDFYLNFGNNNLVIANNIKLDNEDPTNPSILIKLYDALPPDFDLKSEGWIVTLLENPLAYEIEFEDEIIEFNDKIKIQGPNFNLDVKDQVNNSTPLSSYESLLSSNNNGLSTQITTLLTDKNIEINVDYSDFNNFIHFSSAQNRLKNFYNKIYLLEEYSSSIFQIQSSVSGSSTGSIEVLGSIQQFENKQDNILNNFDKYEYFLYYSSSSYAWPKTTSTPPYTLATTTDSSTLSWFGSTNENSPLYGGIILSASLYDEQNKDYLLYSIPEYLREDPENLPYELFVNMLGQHYDNIWVYIKDITNKFDNDNRLNFGISKDLVADTIRDLGIKIYQNNFSTNDLYSSFLGITENGNLFPFNNITGSLPTPQGFEYIDTLISASNDIIPLDDVNKSLYKRIYHNLPYLLNSKGTLNGLRALITSYGIPDTTLRISEFGGKNKNNINDWDYWYHLYNKSFTTQRNNKVVTDWELNPLWNSPSNTPNTIQLRFKLETPTPTENSQSIWFLDNGEEVALTLEYTGSGTTSGSYSGSIIDPYHQYANLKFTADSFSTSSSIYLPFFNGDWWSIMVTKEDIGSNTNYNLHVGNKIYNSNEDNNIGFYITSSHITTNLNWDSSLTSSFGGTSPITIRGNTYNPLSGSLQEIRYYTSVLESTPFLDYVMNPLSCEGNLLNSSPNELAFRASLGGELNEDNISIHPKITGSWDLTSSFTSNSNFTYEVDPIYKTNREWVFIDQPNSGIKNRISNKIQLKNNNIPDGDTLSVFRSLNQQFDEDTSYSPHINYLEVAFSPQNEINDDIDSQLGYFNIGELIGDPILRNSYLTSYPELDKLRNEYFSKYIKNYNLTDYIRLIKYFDNSVFKMVKDFIPARTSLASGVVIKQHKLERNRYPQPTMSFSDQTLTGSIEIGEYNGGTGGSFEVFNGINTTPYGPNGNGPENIFDITQSWDEITPSLLGRVNTPHTTQDEFYNGEFSGSTLIVTQQNLNPGCDPFKQVDPTPIAFFGVRFYNWISEPINYWLPQNNSPTNGYISIWVGPRQITEEFQTGRYSVGEYGNVVYGDDELG